MKDQGVKVRGCNNVLWHCIFDNFESVAAFCRHHGLIQTEVGKLLNLQQSPRCHDGDWRKTAVQLAEACQLAEDMLFPLHLYEMKRKQAVVELSIAELEAIDPSSLMIANTTQEQMDYDRLADKMRDMIDTLTPREQAIIRKRFGIGEAERSLDEVAEDLLITRERVRQIEAKAMRKLRHSSRSDFLKPFVKD